jgi:hypothetical protein
MSQSHKQAGQRVGQRLRGWTGVVSAESWTAREREFDAGQRWNEDAVGTRLLKA